MTSLNNSFSNVLNWLYKEIKYLFLVFHLICFQKTICIVWCQQCLKNNTWCKIFAVLVPHFDIAQQCIWSYLKCTVKTSEAYQRDIKDNEQVGGKCLIDTTCQGMEMNRVQISDVTFSEMLMIRFIEANWRSLRRGLKPRDWWHESRLNLN